MATTTISPLLDLLSPPLPSTSPHAPTTASTYLSRLTSLPLATLQHDEASSLDNAKHTLGLSLQALASRSHKALVASAEQLRGIEELLKVFREGVGELGGKGVRYDGGKVEGGEGEGKEEVKEGGKEEEEEGVVPEPMEKKTALITSMDSATTHFIQTYHRDSPLLAARQTSESLYTHLPRLLDLIELPTLLSTVLSNPPLALDILSHARRLQSQHPKSKTIADLAAECAHFQKQLVTSLVSTLRGSLKLPLAIKTISYLRRTAPELAAQQGGLEALFLVCRLHWITELFSALDPMKEAADEEMRARGRGEGTGGQKTERYFKRWVEVFREQSFAVVGMYRSIFPNDTVELPTFGGSKEKRKEEEQIKSPLQSFTLHLLSLLEGTMKAYLPNVLEKSGREALLTQVLYAAGSLGRLGGDFGMLVAGEDEIGEEWVEVVKRQRVLAGRLEDLTGGK